MRFNLEYAVSHLPIILKYAGMSMNIAVVSMFFTVFFSLAITIAVLQDKGISSDCKFVY